MMLRRSFYTVALAILATASSIDALCPAMCPAGWERIGASCYQYSNRTMRYADAETYCESIRSHLWVPNSDVEFIAVVNSPYVTAPIDAHYPVKVRLGCTDVATEGTYQCVDGTEISVDSDLWAQDEPTGEYGDTPGDCITFHRYEGELFDGACSNHLFALCERNFKAGVFCMASDDSGSSLSGYCLQGHVMRIEPMIGHIELEFECALACMREDRCQSYNLRGQECELNDETRWGDPDQFVSVQDCDYFE